MNENRDDAIVEFFPTDTEVGNEAFKEYDRAGAGAMYADEDVVAGRDGHIYLKVPSNNEKGWEEAGALRVYRGDKPAGAAPRPPCWKITGDVTNPASLTLSPSVHLRGTWHGFLRKGVLESC